MAASCMCSLYSFQSWFTLQNLYYMRIKIEKNDYQWSFNSIHVMHLLRPKENWIKSGTVYRKTLIELMVHICDVISEKGSYCTENSVFLDQLFLHFCDSIFFIKTAQRARKMFPLDAHKYRRPWSDAAHDAQRLIRAYDICSAIRSFFVDDITFNTSEKCYHWKHKNGTFVPELHFPWAIWNSNVDVCFLNHHFDLGTENDVIF